MEKGFNSDIQVNGQTYHVQTEDWGLDNPFLVSRIFSHGAVIRSLKTPYSKVLPKGRDSSSQSVTLAMQVQHQKILDLLVSGQLI